MDTERLIQLPGEHAMRVGPGLFRPGTDSLALAAFACAAPSTAQARQMVDLGCGCGTFPLLLCPRLPALHAAGIEIDPLAARYARENICAAGLAGRIEIHCADLRKPVLDASSADLVISNPPYFALSAGKPPQDSLLAARTDAGCSGEELIRSAARLLRPRGHLFLLWRPESLAALFAACAANGLEPKRIRLARGRRARFLMLECVRGGRPGLDWEPELDLTAPAPVVF